MSDTDIVLKVEGLSKAYFSKPQSKRSIKDILVAPFAKTTKDPASIDALKNVSFELKRGESLGIIGSNGAGKSTLLKILSGVTSPTSGKVTINGRVLSVLDIGTGFHPDLTGRENVYLNGEILGLSKSEIDQKYQEIVGFSEIGNFIDSPVKHYSSGMYLRLAFSVVINMNADLLIFDEVMAVGDASFRQKCQRLIRSLTEKGNSVIMVSHNMTDMLNYCNRVILLDNGEVLDEGASQMVVSRYNETVIINRLSNKNGSNSISSGSQTLRASTLDDYRAHSSDKAETLSFTSNHRNFNWKADGNMPINEYMRLHSLRLQAAQKHVSDNLHTTDQLVLEIELETLPNAKPASLAFQLMDSNGTRLFNSISSYFLHDSEIPVLKLQALIPPDLFNEGVYQLVIATFNNDREIIYFSDFHEFYFKIGHPAETAEDPYLSIGPMKPAIEWHLSAKP